MELELSLTSYARINSKCVKDLNVKLDTVKFSKIFFNLFLESNINKNKNKQMNPN